MRFFPDNIWSLTVVTASLLFGAFTNVANAGGDPNVKDKKVVKDKSNIKINGLKILDLGGGIGGALEHFKNSNEVLILPLLNILYAALCKSIIDGMLSSL